MQDCTLPSRSWSNWHSTFPVVRASQRPASTLPSPQNRGSCQGIFCTRNSRSLLSLSLGILDRISRKLRWLIGCVWIGRVMMVGDLFRTCTWPWFWRGFAGFFRPWFLRIGALFCCGTRGEETASVCGRNLWGCSSAFHFLSKSFLFSQWTSWRQVSSSLAMDFTWAVYFTWATN